MLNESTPQNNISNTPYPPAIERLIDLIELSAAKAAAWRYVTMDKDYFYSHLVLGIWEGENVSLTLTKRPSNAISNEEIRD
uniref:Uncharacterized protein n=1 Tax=viral metagenome TaxID=1070528 RepID=A0A6M3JVM8_9ZZZZ